MFNSNVQPKRRTSTKPDAWMCACPEPGGAFRRNAGYLTRCPDCGVGRQDAAEAGL